MNMALQAASAGSNKVSLLSEQGLQAAVPALEPASCAAARDNAIAVHGAL